MKLEYIIIYVKDVHASVEFFERAFGLKKKLESEEGYAELYTGETTLSFASHELIGKKSLPKYRAVDESDELLGMEIGFTVDSVKESYDKAVSCGAKPLKEPIEMPWKQTVAYVKCPDGTLVELCSRIAK